MGRGEERGLGGAHAKRGEGRALFLCLDATGRDGDAPGSGSGDQRARQPLAWAVAGDVAHQRGVELDGGKPEGAEQAQRHGAGAVMVGDHAKAHGVQRCEIDCVEQGFGDLDGEARRWAGGCRERRGGGLGERTVGQCRGVGVDRDGHGVGAARVFRGGAQQGVDGHDAVADGGGGERAAGAVPGGPGFGGDDGAGRQVVGVLQAQAEAEVGRVVCGARQDGSHAMMRDACCAHPVNED